MEETAIRHIKYPSTKALKPSELQSWLDANREAAVVTEKIDGANTVFWVKRQAEGGYCEVALFSRSNVVYVCHVFDGEADCQQLETVFQADLKQFPVPLGAILQIFARDSLQQNLAAVCKGFRTGCTEVMICGETTHPKISRKIAYGNEARFRAFGLQFKLEEQPDMGDGKGTWVWSDWDEGREILTACGVEHVEELKDVPRGSPEELRQYVDSRISSYVPAIGGEVATERRAEGLVFRTRRQFRVGDEDADEVVTADGFLVKLLRGTYSTSAAPPAQKQATAQEHGALQRIFETTPLEGWIQHAAGHGLCTRIITGEKDGKPVFDNGALTALVGNIHEEVLQKGRAEAGVGASDLAPREVARLQGQIRGALYKLRTNVTAE